MNTLRLYYDPDSRIYRREPVSFTTAYSPRYICGAFVEKHLGSLPAEIIFETSTESFEGAVKAQLQPDFFILIDGRKIEETYLTLRDYLFALYDNNEFYAKISPAPTPNN